MSDRRNYTYLDTSALMRRAETRARTKTARLAKMEPVLDSIFADPGRSFACSELTLLELHSNLTSRLRSHENSDWDQEWWQASIAELMDDIASEKIDVLPTPSKGTEQVMTMVTLATQENDRALRAWDAMHAVVAGRWSYELGSPVTILTSDGDFDAALQVTNFSRRLQFENLDVLAQTREGYDKRNR